MIKAILIILIYFLFPLLIIYLCRRWSFFKKLGAIAVAYGFGILIGSIGLLPQGSEAYRLALTGDIALSGSQMEEFINSGEASGEDIIINNIGIIQKNLIDITVMIAFPLLLFSLNFRRWLRFAKDGIISMILALISIVVIIVSGYFIFRDVVPDPDKVAGMLVGVYTGGTPNMAMLKVSLNVNPNLFLMTSTFDILTGAATLIFFITAGPRVFRAILPPFKHDVNGTDPEEAIKEAEGFEDFTGIFKKGRILPLLRALGMSVLILAVSAGIGAVIPGEYDTIIIILSVTTLAVVGSFIPWLNRTEKSFQMGMYFIIVFSFAVASKSDLRNIFENGSLSLFGYVLWAYFGSLLLHLLLSKIFRVNADDYLITTTAFIYSPPFVPVVAAAMKNRDVIITGITVGILGYVIGNYLGSFLAVYLGSL